MAYPPAIHWSNADAHEIDVRPSVYQRAGVPFTDPMTLRLVVSPRDIQPNELSAALDNGYFRCRKESPATVFNVGDTLSFGTTGYIAGADQLVVRALSASGDKYVFAELNPAGAGGGTGTTPAQVTAIANALIDANITEQTIISNTANNTPPTQADWPGGTPTTTVTLGLVKAGNRTEYWSLPPAGAATLLRITESVATQGEPTAAFTVTNVEPLLDTLSAAALLARVNTEPEYTFATLDDGANISTVNADGEERFYEVVVGVAVQKTVQSATPVRTPETITITAHGLTNFDRPVPIGVAGGAYVLMTTNDPNIQTFAGFAIGAGADAANQLLFWPKAVANKLPQQTFPAAALTPTNTYFLQADGTVSDATPTSISLYRAETATTFDYDVEIDVVGALGGGSATPEDVVHTQAVAAAVWVINHGRGVNAESVSLFDGTGVPIAGEPWANTDVNTVTVTLGSAQTGQAILEFPDT